MGNIVGKLHPSLTLYPRKGRNVGDEFYLLASITVPGFDHIKVEEDTTNSWIGYDSTHGTVDDSDTPILSLISYGDSTNNALALRNRTVITLKGTVTKTLRTVKVEDIVYNVSAVSGTPRAYFLINAGDSSNVTGDFFTDNEDIAVELIYTDASAGKTTRTLDEGLVVFNGYAWVPEKPRC